MHMPAAPSEKPLWGGETTAVKAGITEHIGMCSASLTYTGQDCGVREPSAAWAWTGASGEQHFIGASPLWLLFLGTGRVLAWMMPTIELPTVTYQKVTVKCRAPLTRNYGSTLPTGRILSKPIQIMADIYASYILLNIKIFRSVSTIC